MTGSTQRRRSGVSASGGGGGLAQQVAQEEHPGERLFREDHPGFALQRAGEIDPVERVDAEVELRRGVGIEVLVREARLQPSPCRRGPGIVEQRAIRRRPFFLRPLPSPPVLRRRFVEQQVTAQSAQWRPRQRPAQETIIRHALPQRQALPELVQRDPQQVSELAGAACRERRVVGHHQADARAVVPGEREVGDIGAITVGRLDHVRIEGGAVVVDEGLRHAPHKTQAAVGAERPEVAGPQPAVLRRGRRRCLGVADIAREPHRPANQHLALAARIRRIDPERHARQRQPDGLEIARILGRERDQGPDLGEPVTLAQPPAQAGQPPGERGRGRRDPVEISRRRRPPSRW